MIRDSDHHAIHSRIEHCQNDSRQNQSDSLVTQANAIHTTTVTDPSRFFSMDGNHSIRNCNLKSTAAQDSVLNITELSPKPSQNLVSGLTVRQFIIAFFSALFGTVLIFLLVLLFSPNGKIDHHLMVIVWSVLCLVITMLIVCTFLKASIEQRVSMRKMTRLTYHEPFSHDLNVEEVSAQVTTRQMNEMDADVFQPINSGGVKNINKHIEPISKDADTISTPVSKKELPLSELPITDLWQCGRDLDIEKRERMQQQHPKQDSRSEQCYRDSSAVCPSVSSTSSKSANTKISSSTGSSSSSDHRIRPRRHSRINTLPMLDSDSMSQNSETLEGYYNSRVVLNEDTGTYDVEISMIGNERQEADEYGDGYYIEDRDDHVSKSQLHISFAEDQGACCDIDTMMNCQ